MGACTKDTDLGAAVLGDDIPPGLLVKDSFQISSSTYMGFTLSIQYIIDLRFNGILKGTSFKYTFILEIVNFSFKI